MIANLTLAAAMHATLATLCIGVGLVQFLRPKRGAGHRARGYFYVYAMLVADGAALLMFQLTGRFNVFHVAAIVNLIAIVLAVIPVLRSSRPLSWKIQHYYWISWSYVGLIAAAATEIVVRTGHLVAREQVWTVASAISASVTAIAYILINQYRPDAGSHPPVSDVTIQRDGVQP
jgi:uncharacterized membrane protein